MRRALAFFTLPTTLFLFTGCDGNSNNTSDASMTETDAGTPPPSPKIITFEATMDAVPRGETVELHWKVENAQLINIFSATEILVSTTEPEGVVTTLPIRRRASFDIRAAGYGTVGETVDVEAIWPEPVITEMTLNPTMTTVGGFTQVHWVASEVEKTSIYANGNLVPFAVFMGSAAESSTAFIPITEEHTVIQVKAENPTHTVTRDMTIEAVQPPQILSFVATPRTFVGSSTTVTLTWETQGFDFVDLLQNFSPVPGFPHTLNGTFTVDVEQTTTFSLYGYYQNSVYGELDAVVGLVGREFEPNDDPNQAYPISYEGGVMGSISDTDDVDYYYIDVFTQFGPADLHLWTRGEGAGCPVDTQLELLEPGSLTVLGTDEDDGFPTGRGGSCADINSERDVFAQNLFGAYIIGVRGQNGETGDYVLFSTVTPKQMGR